MIQGRINKELKEICLLDQVYVKAEDGKQSVAQYVAQVAKANNATVAVKGFVRFETGEGIEKKEENFFRFLGLFRVVLNLSHEDFFLMFDVISAYFVAACVLRTKSCNLHCNIFSHLFEVIVYNICLNVNQNTDFTTHMSIRSNETVLLFYLQQT